MNRSTLITSFAAAFLLGATGLAPAQQSATKPAATATPGNTTSGAAAPAPDEPAPTASVDALAKQLSNPIAALISVPF